MRKHLSFMAALAVAISFLASCQKDQAPMPVMVDLGLSVKWRSYNLGASRPEEAGLYYQWGDTQGYGSDTSDGKYFDWKDKSGNVTYKWCNGSYNTLTKYNTESDYGTVDNKTVLDMEDDAARFALGGNWRIPTKAEWMELSNSSLCSWTWTTINGVNGYKVKSKISGYTKNWIFLPAAGLRCKDELLKAEFIDPEHEGCYWSSSLGTKYGYSNVAFRLSFYLSHYSCGYNGGRSDGYPIRPVCE